MLKQQGLAKRLWLRIAVPLVALALLAAACSGTEAAAPDVAASDNDASDTDAGGTTTDNADADDGTTTTTDTAAETAVADDENLDAYEGLNEGEIESAKREEEVRRVIARAEAADAEAAEAETADAVETQPSETRETDTQSTDTQPEETQPSVPRIDADGTERLGDRFNQYRGSPFVKGISERTPVFPDAQTGAKYVKARLSHRDRSPRSVDRLYLDARAPLVGEPLERTYNYCKPEGDKSGEGNERYCPNSSEDKDKYWNEAVPIREGVVVRVKANDIEGATMGYYRVFSWAKAKVGATTIQEWIVHVCQYAVDLGKGDGVEVREPGEGIVRKLRVEETHEQSLGLDGGSAHLKSGEPGVADGGGVC